MKGPLTRRTFLKSCIATASVYGLLGIKPCLSATRTGIIIGDALEDENNIIYELVIRREPLKIGRRLGEPITLNDTFPGPLIRLKEGKNAIIKVRNELPRSTSIHWHGILIPNPMDGVPGVVFPGIEPGTTFEYRFPVIQSGTYWYHSHTGLQEQLGHYGPLILEPREEDPIKCDRDYVVILSDWTFEDPDEVLLKLKKGEGYYNYQKRTIFDLFHDMSEKGLSQTLMERSMWGRMRMSPRDLTDITSATYTYLMNGKTPEECHTFLFSPGETIRLRFINASTSTYYDVRIPGLGLKVVQADGQDVEPVEVDEIRMAVAETYDVLVTPLEEKAYAIFAESMDRSGYAMGCLAPRHGMRPEVPEQRKIQERTMGGHGHRMDMNMNGMEMDEGCSECTVKQHDYDFGPDAAMVVKNPRCRIGEPGVGLGGHGRRVLTYKDLKSIRPFTERPPSRNLEIHLTGNMGRYIWKMWAFDGNGWTSEFHQLIPMTYGERVRIAFVNHTMMDHPIHLHGMWMYIVNGNGALNPRKHTVNIKPGEKLCVDVEADALGNWAFHCHILYHMHAGMFRVVRVC